MEQQRCYRRADVQKPSFWSQEDARELECLPPSTCSVPTAAVLCYFDPRRTTPPSCVVIQDLIRIPEVSHALRRLLSNRRSIAVEKHEKHHMRNGKAFIELGTDRSPDPLE